MSKLPKLKVRGFSWDASEEIRDFEQGKYLPFCEHICIVVEGEVILSYEQLVQLAAQDEYKDKEFLEVELLPLTGGG